MDPGARGGVGFGGDPLRGGGKGVFHGLGEVALLKRRVLVSPGAAEMLAGDGEDVGLGDA